MSYRSLKVIANGIISKRGYGFIFAFYMPVSVAVCDIFSVKEWPDLENRVMVCSRSLEMAPFDRSHMSLNTYIHVPGINRHKYYTVAFKARSRVTQGH